MGSLTSVRLTSRADRIINIATQLNQTRRYQLLSYSGFRITLVPPQTGAIAAFGDVVGNLDEEWEIAMMDEGAARSSMIRREMAGTPAAATMGTDANGWTLASSTPLITGQQSYYGSDEDAGTPGQDSGGPLPVELSHFRPARDKNYWRSHDYMGDAVRAEQRWVLHQAE